ncbi:unnamed protein product, partial [Gongylonema pulchrum]|uniref:CUB domain-containing protein n=1 Tax=Gongylonema pulchrum TaxID=637853 RepID=A0A183CXV6_9BILA
CNDVYLFGHHGVLQSPGYPERTLENRFCKWRIQTTKGNRLRLMFHLFRVTEPYTRYTPLCHINYLEFGEKQIRSASMTINGQHNETASVRRFCDRAGKPTWILSENEFVDITFFSKIEPENHFWLSWANEGCGGDISSPMSVSVDAGKLITDAATYECTWKITAPIGMRVLFLIEKLSIFEISEGCTGSDSEQFAGLAFYSGTSNRTGSAQKVLCASSTASNYTSHTNELFVKFKIPSRLAKPDANKLIMKGEVSFVQPKTGDECGAIIESINFFFNQ